DLEALLDGAEVAAQGCRHDDTSAGNSGLWQGVTLGELARRGRDKLTFVVDDEEISSVGLWLEQLVAESTGKHGRGILPVADEPDDGLDVLIAEAGPERYVAIMAYVPPSPEFDEAVTELRSMIRDMTRTTTTFGYGPRFLHSTGQFHKGGPPSGRFLQLVGDVGPDVEVPGEPYTFRRLKNAQATGDLQT